VTIVFVNRFCHPDHSATSQIVSDLAASLAAQSFSVSMISSRMRYDDPSARLAPMEKWQGVGIYRIWTSRFGRRHLLGRLLDYLSFYWSLPFALWRILERGDVVVAKTDPPLVSLVVAFVARLRGAKMVNWLQDVFPEIAVSMGEPKVPVAAAYMLKKLRNYSLKTAVMNVVIGSRMAEYFQSQAIPANQIKTIPNWAHENDISPVQASESRLRHQLGLGEKFIVGYSGNLGRAHDPDTIFHAAISLQASTTVFFLMIGGGYGYEYLKKRVADAGLKNMQFLPYQPLEALSDSMAAADLHLVSLRPALEGKIVPSKFYGIAAAQRPVGFIGDHDGELARLIKQSKCGFVVSEGQGEELADQILALAGDAEHCRVQGKAARQLLDSAFSRALAHQQWHDLLRELSDNAKAEKLPQ